MRIRKCEVTQVKAVYHLICELSEKCFDYKNFQQIFNHKLKTNSNYCIVAIEDGEVVGFLNLYIDYQLHHGRKVATIEELIVNAKYRSHGMGTLLLEDAIAHARNNNCEVIELSSHISREGAHRFYFKSGFEKSSFKFKMKL